MNVLKTGLLMAVMTAIFIFAGGALGGQTGIVIAVGFALVTNFFSYWYSDKIVLKMYRGQEVGRQDAPQLYELVEKLAKKAGLPMPKVYVLPSEQPNAFATGRNPEHAAVAVTQGLYRMLNERELAGVLAHELAHVKHRDILIGTVAGTMAGAISSLAWMAKWGMIFGGFSRDEDGDSGLALLVMAIVAPIVALIVQMAISRSREYHADRAAGEITGDPMALAEALYKIHHAAEQIPMREAGPATAHLFIASPLSGRSLMNLFSTHPSMEDRIAKLQELTQQLSASH